MHFSPYYYETFAIPENLPPQQPPTPPPKFISTTAKEHETNDCNMCGFLCMYF